MSVGLYKYDGEITADSRLLVSMNIASEEKYYMYLDKAVQELKLVKFRDGSQITYSEKDVLEQEIDRLILWLNTYLDYDTAQFFVLRLNVIKEAIPDLLKTEKDILYIF